MIEAVNSARDTGLEDIARQNGGLSFVSHNGRPSKPKKSRNRIIANTRRRSIKPESASRLFHADESIAISRRSRCDSS